MPNPLTVACVQCTSGPDITENLNTLDGYIRDAAGQGAQFIATPENSDQMRRYVKDRIASSGDMEAHIAVAFLKKLALVYFCFLF